MSSKDGRNLNQSPEEYAKGLWDWTPFNSCFKRYGFSAPGIRIGDIDGIVERKGRFLLLEGKRGKVEIDDAHLLMYQRLLETGLFTIVIFWGIPRNKEGVMEVERIWVLTKQHPNNEPMESISIADLWKIIHEWFVLADTKHIDFTDEKLMVVGNNG